MTDPPGGCLRYFRNGGGGGGADNTGVTEPPGSVGTVVLEVL